MKNYDLAIIGSGPGGYVAALYASRRKLKVCVIEKGLVGGTCLNRGCIPTKSLLNSASMITVIKEASAFGVDTGSVSIKFDKMMSRKDETVLKLRTGIETLFRANSIDLIRGQARISGPDTVTVPGAEDIYAKNMLIAAGSKTTSLNTIKTDEADILSSDGILSLRSAPKSLVIIGGGVIGCEFAGLFNTLGTKVTVVEFMDRLVPNLSCEISKKLELLFKKRGIEVFASSGAESAEKKQGVAVKISGGKVIETEKVFVAVGRTPDIESLGLADCGIKTEKNRIAVDEHLMTSVKGIYAIGDCVGGPLLAHKASYDGILACDNILGDSRKVDYSNVPNCIWTDPEIACVGLTEEEAKSRVSGVKIAKFPYLASGKAFLMGKPEGFIKIIGDTAGNVLGVEIFGAGACELIAEAVLAKTMGINIKDWARAVHGHPTLSEIIQEAAHIFCGTPIHSI
ncbi:MAG: dihydrolipoyl dehydrogenase [Candidatus Omnitrophota bacterium]